MKALVTGGMGFIGSNFVKMHLRGQLTGIDSITVLDSLTYAGSLKNFKNEELSQFKFVKGDIRDRDLMHSLVPRHDLVINFAAESHVDRSIENSSDFISTNIQGVQVILDEVRAANSVQLLQVSTDEVYGSIDQGSWDENQPLHPNSPYSVSKAAADLLVLAYANTYEIDVRITRSCNNFGKFQNPEKLIPLVITNHLLGKQIPIYGTGANVREWIHVEDNCQKIQDVINNGTSGEIYNIGSNYHACNLELVETISDHMGVIGNYKIFVKDRLGHDQRYSVNAQKVNNLNPNFEFRSFQSSLDELVSWYRENSDWWESLIN